MRLQRRVEIDADRDAIWKRVSDPASYPDFMANLERWDEVTDRLNPSIYSMDVVLDRVRRHGDLYADVLTTRQSLAKALRSIS